MPVNNYTINIPKIEILALCLQPSTITSKWMISSFLAKIETPNKQK